MEALHKNLRHYRPGALNLAPTDIKRRASIPKAAELTSQEMGKTWPFKGSLNGLQSYYEGLGTVGVG